MFGFGTLWIEPPKIPASTAETFEYDGSVYVWRPSPLGGIDILRRRLNHYEHVLISRSAEDAVGALIAIQAYTAGYNEGVGVGSEQKRHEILRVLGL